MTRSRLLRLAALLTTTGLATAPLALAADPVGIGVRNPRAGATASQETQIIAATGRDAYGTRQSNTGAGGGAIYGCRSSLDLGALGDPARSTPCLRVNNLRGGKAFDFAWDTGPIGGVFQAGASLLVPHPGAAPFVTNATAVALGLNADRLDGRHAADLVTEARKSAGLNAETVGGLTSTALIAAAQTGGVRCPADMTAAADGCIETAARSAATFADAAGTCGKAGRHLPPVATLAYARSLAGVDLGAGEMAADVSPGQTLSLPAPLGDIVSPTTYATVADDGTIASRAVTATAAYRCASR